MNFIEIEDNLINLDLVWKIEFYDDDEDNDMTIGFVFASNVYYWNFDNKEYYENEKITLIKKLVKI